MQDLVTTPGFIHHPPRERLARHGLNRIRERVARDFTRDEYEALCEGLAAGEFLPDLHEQGLGGRDVCRFR